MCVRRMPSSILALLLTLAAGGTRGDATSDARKQIQERYDKENTAAAKHDANAVLAYYSPDYVSIEKNGRKTTFSDLKQQVPKMLAIMRNIKSSSKVMKLTLKGNTAMVTVTEHADAMVKLPQAARESRLVIDATSLDTWTKTAKGWMKKLSKSLSSKQTLDGKEVAPPGG